MLATLLVLYVSILHADLAGMTSQRATCLEGNITNGARPRRGRSIRINVADQTEG